MPTNIEVPPLGEYVAADEPLAELETDKANVDLPARTAGVLRQAKKPGDTVHVGEAIGRIDEGAKPPASAATPAKTTVAASAGTTQSSQSSQPPAATQPATTSPPQTDDLRPSVRRLVEENRLNPAEIASTGPGGRI